MSENTTILSLPLIQAAQAQKHITHNEAIRILDAIVQPVVADLDRTAPPQAPENGDRHIVAAGATGDWAGQDGTIAVRQDQAWAFFAPQVGWKVHVVALGGDVTFDGSDWRGASFATLGINAEADTTNRLAVSGAATLLNHDGAGHQLKLNKAGHAETNSLLFQTAFSGRAEMGCAGEDAFSIKVSADGADFVTALRFDPVTGMADGAAVQASAGDLTPGKIARVEHTFGPGNMLGPVSEAEGIPTGAVIERGETAEGHFVRFADGTLICTQDAVLTQEDGTALSLDWTPPGAFVADGPDAVQGTVDTASIRLDTSVDPTEIGVLTTDILGDGTIHIRQFRVAGASDFGLSDTLNVRLLAVGRWF